MRRTVLAAAIAGCLSVLTWDRVAAAADQPAVAEKVAPADKAAGSDKSANPDAAPPPGDRSSPRAGRDDPSRRVERGAYLGVSATPAPAVLRRHVGLPPGVGLLVDAVAPDSPAADAGLRPDDLLHKVNDQLLVNQQQLAVLVRTFRAGDAVRLAVLRDGKPVDLSAKLAERDLPPLESLRFGSPDFPFPGDPRPDGRPDGPQWGPGGQADPFRHAPLNLLSDNATVAWDDGAVHLDLTVKGGKKHLFAKDKDGRELYDGPVDTDEQVKALPAEVRDRLPHVALPPALRPGGGPRPDEPRREKPSPREDPRPDVSPKAADPH
jgi:hypothetical protein